MSKCHAQKTGIRRTYGISLNRILDGLIPQYFQNQKVGLQAGLAMAQFSS